MKNTQGLTAALLTFTCIPAGAEFELNFLPNSRITSNIANVHCTTGSGDGVVPGGSGGWGGGGGGGGGFQYYGCGSDYFIQEVVRDPELGSYYHLILGDPTTDDFAMEFYLAGDYNSDSGGNWHNAHDPLGDSQSVTGNGSGNPKRIYMKMINNDGPGFNQEFLKSRQAEKPVITQNIVDGPMRQDFTADMSNSSYDQSNITGDIVNTLFFDDSPLSPGSMGGFDMASGVDKGFVTAGRYRYSNGGSGGGSGWGGDGSRDAGGHYTYEHGGFDVYAVDWLAYCIPEQNTDRFCEYGRGGSGWGGWGW